MAPGAGEALAGLAKIIAEWNEVTNLVSRNDIGRLVSYHFCDSASVLPLLRPTRPMEVLDIGGSNGLPGLVLSSLSSFMRVLVCDSRAKRRTFLEAACSRLGGNARFEIGRVDGEDFQVDHGAFFDLIVARAVTKFRTLLEWCTSILRPGGLLIAYKGSRCMEEVAQAKPRAFDGGWDATVVVGSPFGDSCNPLRLFAIARRAGLGWQREVGRWPK